jgi:hypothetical protein
VKWLVSNYTWVFSGIGVAVIGAIVAIFRRRSAGRSQRQRSGANSVNIQSGRDSNIGGRR